ncbi:PIN domain-containing protein [Tsukamurella soli]|uniref:PIN domain-containing protein n=1 Tax=Tsukamurella soli TaxID=644556 RepID=A0ABP8K8A6_9ACTN
MIYIDTTALVRLVIRHPETPLLCAWMRTNRDQAFLFSSISRQEIRDNLPAATEAIRTRTREVFACPQLIEVQSDGLVRDTAKDLVTTDFGHTRAIHLATIIPFQARIDSILSYDIELLTAAARLGIAPQAL